MTNIIMWCKLTVKFSLYCKPCFSSQANSHHKVVDTEDIHNLSRRHRDGKITSETIRTEKHEVYDDKEAPDDGTSYDEDGSAKRDKSYVEHDEEKYRYTKTDKFTDYYKVLHV